MMFPWGLRSGTSCSTFDPIVQAWAATHNAKKAFQTSLNLCSVRLYVGERCRNGFKTVIFSL